MHAAYADTLLVTFWGARGSVPTPRRNTEKYGGNTACVEVRYNDDRVILDAGTGIRNLGLSLLAESKKEPLDLTVLLSHTHWDHIQGLPFFTPAYLPATKLKIWGSPFKEKVLSDILKGQMDQDYFPIDLSMLGADLQIGELSQEVLTVGKLKVRWQEQHYHPGGSLRFSVEAGGRKLVYASDVELEQMLHPTSPSEETETRKDEYLAFIDSAHMLIGDGQYSAAEYETKQGWGHSAVPTLLATAHAQKVETAVVFHHDPTYTDRMVDELSFQYCRHYAQEERPMNVFWAREGMTVAV